MQHVCFVIVHEVMEVRKSIRKIVAMYVNEIRSSRSNVLMVYETKYFVIVQEVMEVRKSIRK